MIGRNRPLSDYLRPEKLDDIIGQQHLIGPDSPLRRMAERNVFVSSILYGPPGCGKTTLARIISKTAKATIVLLSATSATVSDVRKVLRDAEIAKLAERQTILFIDEIHRFSKNQFDVLLPGIEDGTVILFGATTEKPKFAVNSTILSRCMVWEVKPLSTIEMVVLLKRVLKYYKVNNAVVTIQPTAAKTLINNSSGDCRKLITAMETIVEILLGDTREITIEHVDAAIPEKHVVFDKSGNEHFDMATAYQNAIQNSQADDAIYWLAKWLDSGEDPAYIARRMLVSAFEDCSGNPLAPLLAHAACYATENIGLPECQIAMAYATIEMARSKRNKCACRAISAAMRDVTNESTIHIPPELRAGESKHGSVHGRQVNRQYVNNWRKDVAVFEPTIDLEDN